jgi:hypothetical protein
LNGFAPNYETWVFHSEKYTAVAAEESKNDRAGADRMDEMLEAIRPEFDLDTEDPPTPEVEEFFRLLKALEEPLHKHMKVTLLTFMTRLMAIKSKFFFSNNCYNELLKFIGDVLLNPNKLPKDMYHSKKLVKRLGMDYEKIDALLKFDIIAMQPHFTITMGLISPVATVAMHHSSDRWLWRQQPMNLVVTSERWC